MSLPLIFNFRIWPIRASISMRDAHTTELLITADITVADAAAVLAMDLIILVRGFGMLVQPREY